jgi:hypothetical protein
MINPHLDEFVKFKFFHYKLKGLSLFFVFVRFYIAPTQNRSYGGFPALQVGETSGGPSSQVRAFNK